MKFSTQEEYGLRCLVQIAAHGESASLTIAKLGQLEGITVPNVAKIMRVLRRGGFVRSTRGRGRSSSVTRWRRSDPGCSTRASASATPVRSRLAPTSATARFALFSRSFRTPSTASWVASRLTSSL
jgi:hypothetical protein